MVVGKKGSSNVVWIIGRIFGMWSHVLLNFVKKEMNSLWDRTILLTECMSQHAQVALEPVFCLLFIFLINSMPKCLRCKKEFKSQGFLAHKKSCNLYKCGIRARLTNVLDSDLVASPSNESMILDDADGLGTAEDMLVDDVPVVCNGEINVQN